MCQIRDLDRKAREKEIRAEREIMFFNIRRALKYLCKKSCEQEKKGI
jgi:hypothetical protein